VKIKKKYEKRGHSVSTDKNWAEIGPKSAKLKEKFTLKWKGGLQWDS